MDFFVVFLFGMFGTWTRYEMSRWLPKISDFPFSTLLINLLGCYFFAFLVKQLLVQKKVSKRLILGVGVGFFGGLTTFSSMMLESMQLLEQKAFLLFLLYFFSSAIGGYWMIKWGFLDGKRRMSAESEVPLKHGEKRKFRR